MSAPSTIGIEKVSPEQLCDQLLSEAGLSPRWLPDDIPDRLSQAAETIKTFADLPVLEGEHQRRLLGFGQQVVNYTRKTMGYGYGDSFRASAAVSNRRGNCIAVHEVTSGILAKAGLEEFTLGAWDVSGKHASTSLLIGDVRLGVDSRVNNARILSRGPDTSKPQLIPTIRKALASNKVIVNKKWTDKGVLKGSNHLVNPEDLGNLDPRETPYSMLYLPGSMAVAMFCAMQAKRSTVPKYKKAKQVLFDYAPVL